MPTDAAPEIPRLRIIWIAANLGGAFAGLAASVFAFSNDGMDSHWALAIAIGLGVGFWLRATLLTALVWFFARGLLSYFGETEVDREGDAVKATPNWRLSGDAALDEYLASFSGAYAVTVKSLVWLLIIATVIAIAYVASLFGLVDFSL